MKRFWILIGVLGAAFCSSCEQDCISMEARIELVGFSPAELTEIRLKSYSKGSGFSPALDSAVYNAATCNCYLRNDTLEFSPFINNLPGIRSGFDYELVLPAIGRRYQISEVTENFLTQKVSWTSKVACMNTLSSYRVNGTEQRTNGRSVLVLSR